MDSYKELANLFEMREDLRESLRYYKLYGDLKERIFSEASDRAIADLRVKYETEKKEKEAEIYRLKNIELEAHIIEREQVEEALRDSEEKFRSVVERARDGISIIRDAKSVYVNPSLAEALGYSIDEILGTLFNGYIDPDELDKVEERYHKRMAGEDVPSIYDTVLLRKDGSKMHVELNAGVLTYEGNPCDLVLIRDITERKLAEEALRESEEKYRNIFERSPAGIVVHQKGKVLFLNPAMIQMVGYESADEIVGRPVLHFVHPDYHKVARKNIKFVLSREGELGELSETKLICKDGSVLDVTEIGQSIIYDGKQAIQAYILNNTDRKRAEEELRESRERLKKSLAEKKILLDEVNHRVKNNMQVIISLLNLQSAQADNEEISRILEDSVDRIRTLSLIHNKLYNEDDLTRIDLGGYIRDLTGELFSSHRTRLSDINLVVDVEEVSLPVNKAIPFGLIINELLTNSFKYAFPDGTHGEISVELKLNGKDEVVLIVADNGIGFPADFDVENIENTETLGLQIVGALVSQLDGSLEIDKTEGAKFTIKSPIE
jgi:PAS domain S-box-containing protein